MKKSVFLAAYLLVCGSFLSAELTKAQLWAISLAGIRTEANSTNRNLLNAVGMNGSGLNNVILTLNEDWGIYTREDLLGTLDRLENSGGAASLSEIKDTINEIAEAGGDESVINAILNKLRWNQTRWVLFRYVSNNWDDYENRTIKAWDLGMSVSLCRWGYNVGFITEDEAWQRIFRLARIIQPLYSSWEEYGYDYYMGWVFWAAGSGNEGSYRRRIEPIYRKLLNSYWGWLDWDVDLDAEEEDVPLIAGSFAPPDDNDGTLRYITNDPAFYNSTVWHAEPIPNANSLTVVYEIRVKKINGDDSAGFGMVFCMDDPESERPNYYNIFISVNGQFAVQKRIGSSLDTSFVSWKASSFLETGYGVYNTLRMERTDNEDGATFRIFINGNLAATFNDGDPVNGGNFGLIVHVGYQHKEQFPHIPFDVRFEY